MKEPTAIASATFTVFGVEVKCHVLDDGRRVIEEESMQAIFEAMASTLSDEDYESVQSFSRWLSGVSG